jgi:O-antigen/teichoic acid export membrane protein
MAKYTSDSLDKRYVFKLSATIFSTAMSGISFAIVPRTLGPIVFGNWSFLTNFFQQLVGFADMGSSNALYTKLSKDPGDLKLVRFYWGYISLVTVFIGLFVTEAWFTHATGWLWPGQNFSFVLMAALYGILIWVMGTVGQMVDAHGLTVAGEKNKAVYSVVGLSAIGILFAVHRLNLTTYFFYQYATLLLVIVLWGVVLKRRGGVSLIPAEPLTRADIRAYTLSFRTYCAPLVVYIVITCFTGILDRWILQKFAGSVQQGYYGFSAQLGTVCSFFSLSMSPLIWREFSRASAVQDHKEMSRLFTQYIPPLYSLTAFIGVFFMWHADRISFLMGGSAFRGAVLPLALMCLYPLHQTYGRMSTTVLLALEETKLYSQLAILSTVIGIPLSYFLMAPHTLGGLAAGATGLVIKTLLVKFIGVNLQLWYNAKHLSLRFFQLFTHQIASLAIFTLLVFASRLLASWWLGGTLTSTLTSAALYLILTAAWFRLYPSSFGWTADTVRMMSEKIKFKIKLWWNSDDVAQKQGAVFVE